MHSVTLALPVGFQLDQLRIESVLGNGDAGITYIATDLRLNKRVTVKELLPDSIGTRVVEKTVFAQTQSSMDIIDCDRERFLTGAKILASFSHPAIVEVRLFMEANGTAYMVMDFVDGESYEARLRRIGREPDEDSLMALIGPIMDGLAGEVKSSLLN
jgi:serine/threonine protein kinase